MFTPSSPSKRGHLGEDARPVRHRDPALDDRLRPGQARRGGCGGPPWRARGASTRAARSWSATIRRASPRRSLELVEDLEDRRRRCRGRCPARSRGPRPRCGSCPGTRRRRGAAGRRARPRRRRRGPSGSRPRGAGRGRRPRRARRGARGRARRRRRRGTATSARTRGVGGLVGRRRRGEHPGRAREEVRVRAVGALLLRAGHRVAADEAGVDRARRRLSPFTPPTSVTTSRSGPGPGEQAARRPRRPRRPAWRRPPVSAAGPRRAASTTPSSSARAPREPSRSKPVTAPPGPPQRQAHRAADQAEADDLARPAGSPAPEIDHPAPPRPTGRGGASAPPRGRRGAARTGAGRCSSGRAPGRSARGPPGRSLDRPEQGHLVEPEGPGRGRREGRVDVGRDGEEHADEVLEPRSRSARGSPARAPGCARRTCSRRRPSSVVAPRIARSTRSSAGSLLGPATRRRPGRPPPG